MPARALGRHVLHMRRLRPMRISSLNVDVLRCRGPTSQLRRGLERSCHVTDIQPCCMTDLRDTDLRAPRIPAWQLHLTLRVVDQPCQAGYAMNSHGTPTSQFGGSCLLR